MRTWGCSTARYSRCASIPLHEESISASDRLSEVFDSQIRTEPKGRKRPRLDRDIRFEKVWFGYDPLFPIIKGVNATIKKGKITALVGKSGAGKSTIAKLLLGLYSLDGGS